MKPLDQSNVEFSEKGQFSRSSELCDADTDADKLGFGIANANENENENENEKLSTVLVDLEAGVCVLKKEGECRICRICHFSYDTTAEEFGCPIELGCSCKGDLATAHKQCAEAWFKIRGSKTCEVCGSTASNVNCDYAVNSEPLTQEELAANRVAQFHPATAVLPPAVSNNFWEDHRLLNILLAVMVFAFVISWLFHFKSPKLS